MADEVLAQHSAFSRFSGIDRSHLPGTQRPRSHLLIPLPPPPPPSPADLLPSRRDQAPRLPPDRRRPALLDGGFNQGSVASAASPSFAASARAGIYAFINQAIKRRVYKSSASRLRNDA